jgi:hypothetical protein
MVRTLMTASRSINTASGMAAGLAEKLYTRIYKLLWYSIRRRIMYASGIIYTVKPLYHSKV